jgi:hypothetical protein
MGRCEAALGVLSCNDDGSGRSRTAAKGASCRTFSRTECGRSPPKWRPESPVMRPLRPRWPICAQRQSSEDGVSVELRPHEQRETVPIGLVELSPYRVDLTSVGWRRIAHINRRWSIQLIGPLTNSFSSTRDLAAVHAPVGCHSDT